MAARLLRLKADAIKTELGHQRAQVVGRPEDLRAEAARHETQADDLQTVWATVSAQVRGLAQSWKGDHYTEFAREGVQRVEILGKVIRGLRREASHLKRIMTALRESVRRFDVVIEQLEAKARLYIAQTPIQRVFLLDRQLNLDIAEARRESQKITGDLSGVLNLRPEFFPVITATAQQGNYLRGTTGLFPEPRPQDSAGEFDDLLRLEIGRINSDESSIAMMRLRAAAAEYARSTWDAPRLGVNLMGTIHQLFRANAPLDTKPQVADVFGMSARNDFTTPVPPDVGTIDGQQVTLSHDLIGNIHYGYLNHIAGVPPWIYEGGAQGADLLYNYSLERADALAVRIGRELAEQYPDPAGLRPEHIREALRRHLRELYDLGGFNLR